MALETVITERRGRVGLISLNQPDSLNALSDALIRDISAALDEFEADEQIGCIVLTGNERAFAAGADITEIQEKSYHDQFRRDFVESWECVANCRKPLICAVGGYALGGGAEIAMMCDFIIAAESAKFGQPEVTLGIMPGAGGTQRLARFIGKAKAMDMCLTGRMMDAAEAERAGLVSRVVPVNELVDEAIKIATKIADFSLPSLMLIKESVNRAFETPLAEGVRFERRQFYSLFATQDQKEGMAAFSEKRAPQFKNK